MERRTIDVDERQALPESVPQPAKQREVVWSDGIALTEGPDRMIDNGQTLLPKGALFQCFGGRFCESPTDLPPSTDERTTVTCLCKSF